MNQKIDIKYIIKTFLMFLFAHITIEIVNRYISNYLMYMFLKTLCIIVFCIPLLQTYYVKLSISTSIKKIIKLIIATILISLINIAIDNLTFFIFRIYFSENTIDIIIGNMLSLINLIIYVTLIFYILFLFYHRKINRKSLFSGGSIIFFIGIVLSAILSSVFSWLSYKVTIPIFNDPYSFLNLSNILTISNGNIFDKIDRYIQMVLLAPCIFLLMINTTKEDNNSNNIEF